MVRAVHSLHSNGIIHLDLKPANFVLVKGIVKLIDFGISYNLPSCEATSLGMKNSAGTVNYMAPEQLKMKRIGGSKEYRVGKKADVWALGCILHYMAFCETPYHSIPDQAKKMKSISNMTESVPVKVSNHGTLGKRDLGFLCFF